MKNAKIYIIIGIFIVFVLPILCTKGKKEIKEAIQEITKSTETESSNFDYSNFATIKLYHSKTSSVDELPIDTYLYGVVSSEMPATYEKEALKAQAIVARTYTIYQIIHSKRKTY